MNIYLLAFVGGVLLALGFSPVSLFILPLIGFVPLFFALERTSSRKQRLSVMYLFFFTFHGIGNWWVSSWQPNADPFLMASGIALWLGHPFFFHGTDCSISFYTQSTWTRSRPLPLSLCLDCI